MFHEVLSNSILKKSTCFIEFINFSCAIAFYNLEPYLEFQLVGMNPIVGTSPFLKSEGVNRTSQGLSNKRSKNSKICNKIEEKQGKH